MVRKTSEVIVKAISLWQPWASLVAHNWKHYETRSFKVSYRGLLVIHAAKRLDDLDYWFVQPDFNRCLTASGYKWHGDLPRGAALGIVKLVDIQRTEHIRHRLGDSERVFGNYEDGRFAWKLEFVERFTKPIPMRGAQGLFDCTLPMEIERR
jgi:activating signal cointegrator 1